MRRIEWYFDFVSPFPYLQLLHFHQLPEDVVVECRPILFSRLLDHWGSKGPAEIPEKRRFTFRHVQWQAERLGLPFRFPPRHPFNPLRPLRLAIALGCRREAVEHIYRFIWGEGRDIDDAANWRALLASLGVEDGDALVNDPKVKNALRSATEEAIARGVFGVPTIIAGGELFWGFDALPMLAEHLDAPGFLDTPEMRRVGELPVGLQRKI